MKAHWSDVESQVCLNIWVWRVSARRAQSGVDWTINSLSSPRPEVGAAPLNEAASEVSFAWVLTQRSPRKGMF